MQSEISKWSKSKFSNFPPNFKKDDVTRINIEKFLNTSAEEYDSLKQPQQMLIASFNLTNGTFITPLFNF